MKVDDETCVKNVKSLMFKGFNLLEVRNDPTSGKQTPTQQSFRDDTVIGINEAFTSKLNRIVFPTPVLEEVYKKGKDYLMI